MSDEDVVWMGAAELGRRIAAGEVTSRQATIAYLDRIAALNPALEAYVTVTADRALTEAAARDAELARGHRRGPLHGVPYCLKDVIATGGIRTTAGSTNSRGLGARQRRDGGNPLGGSGRCAAR